ncbi:radical SAM protein [Spirosoma sp. HMF3257]|uniref:Radical SAM protein n=1 Tax=Spirosoma telluris TaxID=2183553 RepID=A0A327NW25_9BACT|nr:radical SAM protein [Spirosoma telluris]RAI78044.1 radical SAM protein [Spirosoma telluris]
MKPRLLFSNTYFYRFDSKQWKTQKPYPPYGTILAASIMRELGFEVSLFDTNLSKSPLDINVKLQDYRPDYLIIFDDNFNYLSKMCLTVMREACFELIRLGKASGCKVLINSADATDHFDKYLHHGADVVLLGEAEETLKQVLNNGLANLEDINGIAFIKADLITQTKKANSLEPFSAYPLPAWDLVNLDDYQKIWQKSHGYFSLNIVTTRGCPFKCNWCAKPIYGNRYKSRSPQDVANELRFLMQQGATHFWVCDDIFGLKSGWVNEFKKILQESNLNPKLKIQSRADLLVKDNAIQDLVDAGLDEVWIGAESGSQRILDAMDKGITLYEIENSTQLLRAKGVKVAFFYYNTDLGEQWEDIQKTLSMVKKLLPFDLGISVSYPLPGTVFYEKVKSQLQSKQNWKNSNDLDMMYKGTFSPNFYRHLHIYTHRVYRKELALKNFPHASIKTILKIPYLWVREQISAKKMAILLNQENSNSKIQIN